MHSNGKASGVIQWSPKPSGTVMPAIRVAFLNHVGSSIGGAERTLATFLKHKPTDVFATVILFEDGPFAEAVRALDIDVSIVEAPKAVMSTQRERLGAAAVLGVPALAVSVARVLRRLRVDVLYTNSMKAHIVGSVAGRLSNVPCVMHFHDIIEGTGLRILRFVARVGSTRRVACSQTVSTHIGVGATTVVFGPIEAHEYTDLPSPERARTRLGVDPQLPTVSLVGRINRWKGQDRFVRIAGEVAARRPVQFLIVGSPMFRDADFLPELEAMVRDGGLEHVVRFVPWVDDVRDVYAATDINANCSTREPLGRTPAEAAAAGIPSVVFDDSGAAEWMRTSGEGRVVPAWDERRFADAIVELLDEGAATHLRSTEIRRSAQRFDADTIAAEMAAVMRQAVRR